MSNVNGRPKLGVSLLTSSLVASDTIANTSTETAFQSTVTIPANTLKVGDVIEVMVAGTFGVTSTPTQTWEFALGATSTSTTGTMAATSGVGGPWEAYLYGVVTAIGAAGTIELHGLARMLTDSVGSAVTRQGLMNSAPMTVDTTAAIVITCRQKWSAADASNTITLRQIIGKLWPK